MSDCNAGVTPEIVRLAVDAVVVAVVGVVLVILLAVVENSGESDAIFLTETTAEV